MKNSLNEGPPKTGMLTPNNNVPTIKMAAETAVLGFQSTKLQSSKMKDIGSEVVA